MKKPSQIRRNLKAVKPAAQTEARAAQKRVRFRFLAPKALNDAVKDGAKQAGLTVSAFVERAMREKAARFMAPEYHLADAKKALKKIRRAAFFDQSQISASGTPEDDQSGIHKRLCETLDQIDQALDREPVEALRRLGSFSDALCSEIAAVSHITRTLNKGAGQ